MLFWLCSSEVIGMFCVVRWLMNLCFFCRVVVLCMVVWCCLMNIVFVLWLMMVVVDSGWGLCYCSVVFFCNVGKCVCS